MKTPVDHMKKPVDPVAATDMIATLDAVMVQAEPWHHWYQVYPWMPRQSQNRPRRPRRPSV